jgi:hypothetical protein
MPKSDFDVEQPKMSSIDKEKEVTEQQQGGNRDSSSDSDSEMAESSLNGFQEDAGGADSNAEHVQKCLRSKRILQGDELLRLSKNVGSEWRRLGNALKFNFTKLDALEAETQTQSDTVHKMMQDWLAWKQDKATVGRITKALYLSKEWEAIDSLNP